MPVAGRFARHAAGAAVVAGARGEAGHVLHARQQCRLLRLRQGRGHGRAESEAASRDQPRGHVFLHQSRRAQHEDRQTGKDRARGISGFSAG